MSSPLGSGYVDPTDVPNPGNADDSDADLSEDESEAEDGWSAEDDRIAESMRFGPAQREAYAALDPQERAAFAGAIRKSDGHSYLEQAVYNRVMDPEGSTGKGGMTTVEAFESQAQMYQPYLGDEEVPGEGEHESAAQEAEEPAE